jgi:transposase
MDIVHPRVAGIDVHKKVIWVAVRLPGPGPGDRKVIVKSFRTFWRSLLKMTAWLAELGVTDTAMESTGVYWWPVYHALATAGVIEVCVCNAAHMRNVPGRKTSRTASGSPGCTSTGCCGPASSRGSRWRRCGRAPGTARS